MNYVLYDYIDKDGVFLYQVIRFYPKKFYQRRWIEGKGWIYNLNGTRKVLYRLPEVIVANRIFIVEGEKDVHTLEKLGLVATTCAGGANAWRDEYNEYFKDKEVIIIPDNDKTGKQFAHTVAKGLFPYAKSIKIIEPYGLRKVHDIYDINIYQEIPRPEGYDITDWINEGHILGDLMSYVNDSENYITLKELEEQEPDLKEKPKNIKYKSNLNGFAHTKEIIDLARQYPIENLLDVDKTGKAYCINPEHEDKHRSLDCRNGFSFCYGCEYRGDVIDIYMKLNNVSFYEAIKVLYARMKNGN